MHILAGLGFLLLSTVALAIESTLPEGCQAVAVQGEMVTVEAEKQNLVFIHNLMSNDLWITHPVTDSEASAGWTSQLQSDKWSALALEKGPFILNCIESIPGHEQQVPCEGSVAVCQWKKVKFPENAKGTFWAAENKSLKGIFAEVGTRGFVISNISHE